MIIGLSFQNNVHLTKKEKKNHCFYKFNALCSEIILRTITFTTNIDMKVKTKDSGNRINKSYLSKTVCIELNSRDKLASFNNIGESL